MQALKQHHKNKIAPALWDHQRAGLALIERRPAAMLAWEMGTGKSRAVVETVNRMKAAPNYTLILAPKAVVGVWPREFARYGDGDIAVIAPERGSVAQRVAEILDRGKRAAAAEFRVVVVVNYEAFRNPAMRSAMTKAKWDLAVLDESHRIKSPYGVTSRAVRTIKAAKRICLSGTPIPHSPLDLWSQFAFLEPNIFPSSFAAFKARYCEFGGFKVRGKPVQVTGFRRTDELNRRFHLIANRVKKSDVLDLPDFLHERSHVALAGEAARMYAQMESAMRAEIDAGTVTAANALVKILRLQQITSGEIRGDDDHWHKLHDRKERALCDLIEDIGAEHPVVVFARFRQDLAAIRRVGEKLKRPVDEISGGINTVGSKWEPAPGAIAAIQIQAGSLGIDLTASCYAVYYSQTHSLGDYEQSMARLHRPGQRHRVTYIHLVVPGSIDTKILTALENRTNVIESIIASVAAEADRGAD